MDHPVAASPLPSRGAPYGPAKPDPSRLLDLCRSVHDPLVRCHRTGRAESAAASVVMRMQRMQTAAGRDRGVNAQAWSL